ncbi:CoA ester lyase [Baekduia soli]|uniref:CoA ester lyase n=1 Tax=Baekduia soli TaxID=496014 RepID=A0A5B8TZH3_9ACTN|nr:CoA ester lyase [Baekduia soli]QEC46125.1 CoA ester lyase [Baekduia soli]
MFRSEERSEPASIPNLSDRHLRTRGLVRSPEERADAVLASPRPPPPRWRSTRRDPVVSPEGTPSEPRSPACAPRSHLYAPGDRADLVEKALAGEADVVVADLEDAVPADRKDRARAYVVALLGEHPGGRLHVRVNAVGTPAGRADLAALAGAPATTIRLPKVDGPEVVREAAVLLRAGGGRRLSCLLESALGVERAPEIARAHPSVAAIALGEADLRADLGVAAGAADAGLAHARGRCVLSARAAGLPAPVQSVFTDVRDLDGLARSTRAGRDAGFFGRSAVHPRQVPVINAAFTPTADELADARALVDALVRGDGNTLLADGRYVDRAVVELARRTLAWDDPTPETEEAR